jgi:hypothetical protein
VSAWKAEAYLQRVAGVQIPYPLPKFMKYNCRHCKKELDTMLSILRCPTCKADVSESIEIADKLYQEEQRELRADRERRGGVVYTEHRNSERRDDGF